MEEVQEVQKAIQKAIEESIKNDFNPNKPIFEFVATYDAGTLTKYIGR